MNWKKILFIVLMCTQAVASSAWENLMTGDTTTVYIDISKGQSTKEVVTVLELRDCGEQRDHGIDVWIFI